VISGLDACCSSTLAPVSELRLRRDVIWREADGEVLALDGDSKNYVSANASGLVLWRTLLDGASRDELVDRLVAEYGVDAAQARQDVDAFVAELAANGFLES
jgi:hypothetical protein